MPSPATRPAWVAAAQQLSVAHEVTAGLHERHGVPTIGPGPRAQDRFAAIAQSIMATYTGMSEALRLGWPLGPVAAAAIGLQGFNQVAQIRAQQFKGGGGGNAASNTAAVNAGTSPVGGQGGQAREVVVSGVSPDSLFSGAQLVELINKAQRDGAVVMRFA